jgi:hypothetical protein
MSSTRTAHLPAPLRADFGCLPAPPDCGRVEDVLKVAYYPASMISADLLKLCVVIFDRVSILIPHPVSLLAIPEYERRHLRHESAALDMLLLESQSLVDSEILNIYYYGFGVESGYAGEALWWGLNADQPPKMPGDFSWRLWAGHLSEQLANGETPFTDLPSAHDRLISSSRDVLKEYNAADIGERLASAQVISSLLAESLPAFRFVSYDDALLMRDFLSDERENFAAAVETLSSLVTTAPSEPGFELELRRLAKGPVAQATRELRTKARSVQYRRGARWTGVALSPVPASLVTAMFTGVPAGLAFACSLGAAALRSWLADRAEQVESDANGLAILLKLPD